MTIDRCYEQFSSQYKSKVLNYDCRTFRILVACPLKRSLSLELSWHTFAISLQMTQQFVEWVRDLFAQILDKTCVHSKSQIQYYIDHFVKRHFTKLYQVTIQREFFSLPKGCWHFRVENFILRNVVIEKSIQLSLKFCNHKL